MVRHPKRFFAAIKYQRHNQIFFIVEMADQPLKQCATRIHVIATAAA
jgi:hypothetical protein